MTANGLLVGSAGVLLKEVSGYVSHLDWQALASLDMRKHDVQEKIGSLLVLLAIGLQLEALGGLFQSKSQFKILHMSSQATVYKLYCVR